VILYKYRSNEDQHVEKYFIDKTFYFARAEEFNDPFDCSVGYIPDPNNIEEVRELCIAINGPEILRFIDGLPLGMLSDLAGYIAAPYIKSIEKAVSEIGVFSLSEICNDILMWSHYANRHTGFCMGFEVDETSTNLYQIAYKDQLPTQREAIEVAKERNKGDTAQLYREKFLLQKSIHWQYECEWRQLIHIPSKGSQKINYSQEDLKEVVFGCRTSDKTKEIIKRWLHEGGFTKAKLFQAEKSKEGYSLDIVPL
jgi:hypothetical protein